MKILFIGNSYTYFNDMPSKLRALIEENGGCAEVYSVTKGGRKLCQYADIDDEYSHAIEELAADGDFDVLILQEQSYFALVDREKFLYGVKELAGKIGARRTLLYATWGRGDGCPLLDEHGWTRKSMTEGLLDAYREAAELIFGEVSAVGSAFYRVLEVWPEAKLYEDDLSHPSALGTALGVLVHYRTICGALPQKYSSLGIEAEDAARLAAAISGGME